VFQSHEAHNRILKKSEFDMAPEKFWMRVIEVGDLQSHLLGKQVQLVGTEIRRGMGVGKKLVY
jgi:hypothetical protein